ncbi:MAG: error-prone DNA polymerase [Planctomycetes bacterium]|nr:error-prone DNA polymerase [Planctomycetota bacterium]
MPALAEPLRYAELQCASNFTFERGASHPDELVERAAALGYHALALTDRCSLAGLVRAHVAARATAPAAGAPPRLKLLAGCEVELVDGPRALLYATDRAAYGRLSRLVTAGRRAAPKGQSRLDRATLAAHAEGLLAIGLPDEAALLPRAGAAELARTALQLRWLAELFEGRAWLAARLSDGPDDRARLARLDHLAAATRLPLVAVGGVEAHDPARRALRDTLAAIRAGCTVAELGARLLPEGVRPLRPLAELQRLYGPGGAGGPGGRLELLERTLEVAARCTFSLAELRYAYPDEGDHARLTDLALAGARERWPAGIPAKVQKLLAHELKLIAELRYEPYFLTVHELVAFARSRGILCQGRGSAANSAVCYCLGITSVDPDRFDVLFERFLSKERDEPPDIDIDFEHERREEVLQHLWERHGRDRCAMTGTVITWRGRSAVRDVGKALGLSLDQVERLAGALHHWSEIEWPDQELAAAGFDPRDATLQRVIALARELHGFPRHLSQHVGGMVMTAGRLDELCPIENAAMEGRTVLEWDKDDLDAVKILKVDCLSLGMLSAIRRCFALVRAVHGIELTLANVPADDPATWAMIQRADTVGTFQVESRAQMAMLPRLKPRCFYDLVIEVAIVRPGPIQGGMVHPYLRRRAGEEAVDYPSEAVRAVLEKTLGVPIFQEQAMKLAVVAAGFTPGEADLLRRAMGAWRRPGLIATFEKKLVDGMLQRGYSEEFARRVFEQLKGFGEYGFPESHAASFALLSWVSCWLKRHHPAALTCALLNSQPMGFYAPAQLVRDARQHGVEVRPVDVASSDWECTLETDGGARAAPADRAVAAAPARWGARGPALRLGLCMVKGLSAECAQRIVAARAAAIAQAPSADRPFADIEEVTRRAALLRREARLLAEAGAFGALAPHRRAAWWEAAVAGTQAPLFAQAPPPAAAPPRSSPASSPPKTPSLPPPREAELVVADYALTGLTLHSHPLHFLRAQVAKHGGAPCSVLARALQGARIAVAGLVLHRQKPGTASGILFMTLEDESGIANVIVREREQQRFRLACIAGRLLLVRGRVERVGDVVHLLAERVVDLTEWAGRIEARSRDFR